MSKKEKKVQKDTGPGLSSHEDISSSDHKSEYNEEDYQKLNDDYLRLAAEFENYKKRISKDQESIAISTISMFALSLLPLVDSFENALEQGKGNEIIKETFQILNDKKSDDFHFSGYIEGNELMNGRVNVIVSDGFTGNVALKTAEGTANFITDELKKGFRWIISW